MQTSTGRVSCLPPRLCESRWVPARCTSSPSHVQPRRGATLGLEPHPWLWSVSSSPGALCSRDRLAVLTSLPPSVQGLPSGTGQHHGFPGSAPLGRHTPGPCPCFPVCITPSSPSHWTVHSWEQTGPPCRIPVRPGCASRGQSQQGMKDLQTRRHDSGPPLWNSSLGRALRNQGQRWLQRRGAGGQAFQGPGWGLGGSLSSSQKTTTGHLCGEAPPVPCGCELRYPRYGLGCRSHLWCGKTPGRTLPPLPLPAHRRGPQTADCQLRGLLRRWPTALAQQDAGWGPGGCAARESR